MQKKFLTNLALLLFLNLLIKPFWILGIDRSVQNAVGADAYGEYYALFNFSFLLNILLDFGITNFNNKNIAQNNQLLTKHLSRIMILKLLLGVGYLMITLLSGLLIGYDIRFMKLLLILAFNQFLILFILYLRSNLAGLHLFRTDSVISVLDRVIMIAICAVLLWGNVTEKKMNIMMFVYSQTGAYFLTAVITFFCVYRKIDSLNLSWNFPFFMMILKQSFPYAVLVLLMTFYNRIDTVMLERILPDGALQSGIYAQAYRLLDATNMIAFLYSALLLPIFSKMLKLKEPVEDMVMLSFRLLTVPAMAIAAVCVFFRQEIMDMLYIEYTAHSAPVFAVLMCCFVPISTTYIFGTLLTSNGNLRALNIMAASGMAFNIILNLILIPRYSALGSAVSSLITQALTAVAQVAIAQYVFKFKLNYRLTLKLLLFVAGLACMGFFLHDLPFDWKINALTMIVLAAIFALSVRLVSIRALYQIVKYG